MELTGKAKEKFLEWWQNKIKNEGFQYFKPREDVYLNALIIEFFDSVGIYIFIKRFTPQLKFDNWYFIITNTEGVHLNNHLECIVKEDSRQEATEQAIIKANEIYNAKTS